jgi:hypothetical protein
LADDPPWAAWIASINAPLRIAPEPLMPRLLASFFSSGSTMPFRPPDRGRLGAVVFESAEAPGISDAEVVIVGSVT